MKRLIGGTQQLGRALMLPIAVLPIAGLLLRLGQPDLLDIPSIAAAGNAIFANLGLIFAIGVAVGFARENHGAAGLAAVVGFLVATKGAEVLINVPPAALGDAVGAARDLAAAAYKSQQLAKLSVPVGIISGLIAGLTYNRYSDIRLPSYLAFFAGRRFIPIATGTIGLLVAFAFGYGWPYLEHGMDTLSRSVLDSGNVGLFAYGVLNRVLIVTGLHHIINNLAWFLLGDYHGVTGDLKRFFAGDPSAGQFMSGYFPVMMFGLPAACLAMYHSASVERRRGVGGLLLSMALTSFLTGVTEPIEFTFMFLAPVLYAVHALLTGAAMVIMKLLGVHLGFSFSAGLFDFVLNFNRATRPLWLLPVGAGYFAAYYLLFRFFIARFNLGTPGRGSDDAADGASAAAGTAHAVDPVAAGSVAAQYIAALGGAGNLRQVDACTTRLRLQVADRNGVDAAALRRLGASGTIQLSDHALQVVVGPVADQLAGDMRAEMLRAVATTGATELALAAKLRAVLGGSANVSAIESRPDRVLIVVLDDAAVDSTALRALVPRGIAHPEARCWHLLLGAAATAVSAALATHP